MRPASVVIGGSRGLGLAIAEQLASDGHDLVLTARPSPALDAAAADLRARFRVVVEVMPLDVTHIGWDDAATFVSRCFDALPSVARVYMTVGTVHRADEGTASAQVFRELLSVNCLGPSILIAAFTERMRVRPGRITVVSSVAAVRARGRNLAYAASKRALETFVDGLRHALGASPLQLDLVRVGYLRTRLTEGERLLLPPADVSRVAAVICRGRAAATGVRYVPWFWFVISTGVRMMPWNLFRRVKF